MATPPPFVHLHVHTHYSVLDGLSAIPALVKKAASDGMGALAITDHGNMFGAMEFVNAIGKHNKGVKSSVAEAESKLKAAEEAGDSAAAETARTELEAARSRKLKPIIGCEMYVASGDMRERSDKKDTGRHLVVLAKNATGYRNLIKLVSKAWTEGFYFRPRIDKAHLAEHREGLIICSACLGGEIPRLLLAGDTAGAEEAVKWWKSVFGDDYYIELQRHKATVPRANHETYRLQQSIEPQLIDIANRNGVKIICSNDCHFVDEADAEAHDRLICLSTNKFLNDETRMLYSKQEWFKTRAEMEAIFSDLPQALANTTEIAAKVEEYSIEHAPIMPFYAIPAEFGTEEEYRSRITEEELFAEFTGDEHGNTVLSREAAEKKIKALGGYDKLYRIKFEADYLAKIAFEGAHRRYGEVLSPEVEERIRFELHIMKTMGFPGYFLIVEDFIRQGRAMGVSIGPGRGSAAGSVVAYCLGITQIDPLKYDLLFERFLNPDRISLPDIDIDFDDDGREDVLNYVTERYGAPNVAHIITYGTMAAKTSIKDVARVMSYPIDKSNALTRLVPDHMPIDPRDPKKEKELKQTVGNLIDYVDDFKKAMADPEVAQIMEYARKLEGTVRNTGVHACGVIICRDDITDWVPVSTAQDKNGDRILVTQYEGSVIESTGLIKMDFLGLKTLSIIRDAVANIKAHRGIDIDMDTIPLDDKATYELYSRGATVGTFQFESAGMQRYLRELKPTVFEDLIAMNALYRPGPMENIPEFIERKHGRHPITYDIPEMEKYLSDTYGITVYQEQVMLLSRLLANFTRGESDTLRKAMGKKLIDKMNHLKGKFLEGGQANGHDPKVLEKIWADWEKFASYAFNKSHATCYSWVAFQTAYLKANYPAEYMAAVLSRNRSDITKLTNFMDECKAMKIPVKGPDVNESFNDFGVNRQGDIRFGLAAVKGVGDNVVAAIIQAREEGGRFESPYDFVERVPASVINRRTLDSLILAGAFDCFPDIKREDYFEKNNRDETFSEQLLRYGQSFQNASKQQTASLFGDMDAELNTAGRPAVKSAVPWVDAVKLEKERELVGMYLSAHPLDPYYMELNYGLTSIKEFNETISEDGKEISFGGMVTKFESRPSRKGGNFGIMAMEDYSGTCELRLFGQKYIDFSNYGKPGTPILVSGRFERRYNGEISFEVLRIRLLNDVKGNLIKGVTLELDLDALAPNFGDLLKEHITSSGERKGHLNVRLFDKASNRWVKMTSGYQVPLNRELAKMLESLEIKFDFIQN